MTRNIHNWSYKDVTDFLTENGFTFSHQMKGSHEAWGKLKVNGEPATFVEVCRPKTCYKPKTLKAMIDQSGIPRTDWIKWSRS